MMKFQGILTAAAICGLLFAGGSVHAQQAQKPAEAPKQADSGGSGFFSIFNSFRKSDSAGPIFLDQGTSGGSAPAGNVSPYRYNAPRYSRVTGDGDPFAEAMASVDAKNKYNSDVAAAYRQQEADMAMEAEKQRISQFERAYGRAAPQPGKKAAVPDNRKMIYDKKDTRSSDEPPRLFNTR